MRRLLLVLLTGAIAMSPAAAANWPEPDQLPTSKEMPDPLVMRDGTKITTAENWKNKRRPELVALFEHYMYGPLPGVLGPMSWAIEHENHEAFGGKATLREVAVTITPGVRPIRVLLVTPNGVKGKVPAFVGMNFSGNHALVDDPKVRVPDGWMYAQYPGVKSNRATEAGRGKLADVWAIDDIIARGYAVATLYNGDIDPDNKEQAAGVQRFWKSKFETSTIMAWAWGIMRVVDFLQDVKEIDAKRIAVVGHSRLGKTALVAAAFDERIALVIPHQSGTGGAAPSRSKNSKSESVERINTSFPHWFNDEFKKFNKQVEKLPFDQNCLAALVAPRPLLFTNALEDQWANPDGQFDVLKSAEPVYKLLGAGGFDANTPPPPGKLIDSTLGYYIREGKHSMTREDWKVFLDYADKHLKGRK
jgi:dienelactone hydrolase